MKIGKKALVALSFTVGACLFVTTALADMVLGSGYDRLKETAKHTAQQMEETLDSFTMYADIAMKLDGKVMYENTALLKSDRVNRASETTDHTVSHDGKTRSSHTYTDDKIHAYKSSDRDQYFMQEYAEGNNRWSGWDNPFEEDGAEDMEKILDALVGNLKDDVIVEDRAEGGYVYRGTLSEVQVPALVNAVLSFVVKQTMMDSYRYRAMDEEEVAQLVDDIYVKRVSGRAEENAEGLAERVQGEIILSGADEDGVRHELALSLELRLADINETIVVKPDLTGAEVEIVYDKDREQHPFNSKHIGTYRSSIIVETPDEFIKIGERTVMITSVDSEKITGTYAETIDPVYADEYDLVPLSFEFTTEQLRWDTVFTYTDHTGKEWYADIRPSGSGNLYLYMTAEREDDYLRYSAENENFWNGDFARVFE